MFCLLFRPLQNYVPSEKFPLFIRSFSISPPRLSTPVFSPPTPPPPLPLGNLYVSYVYSPPKVFPYGLGLILSSPSCPPWKKTLYTYLFHCLLVSHFPSFPCVLLFPHFALPRPPAIKSLSSFSSPLRFLIYSILLATLCLPSSITPISSLVPAFPQVPHPSFPLFLYFPDLKYITLTRDFKSQPLPPAPLLPLLPTQISFYCCVPHPPSTFPSIYPVFLLFHILLCTLNETCPLLSYFS